ncbi:hypothetical protein [Actinomadura sp. HBU206391]|uniref:hypothetical protein n=1 Tax=Actinomadura sp. HBU206391 TaxID=2731692 RepID=UPI00164F0D00|nr:hypothetical protein [Actinomadura sp. HBU206391]MBC6456793.1 hypothetical protein [Actinomadura sp. HBU206391]
MRVRLPIAALVLVPLLASCGSGGDIETSIPPLTPEPTITLPPQDAASERRSLPARTVLYRYLRSLAAGDPRGCGHLAPAYDRATFGSGGCRNWMPQAARRLTAGDLNALRGVTVPIASEGPGRADYTVHFTDLQWRTEPAQPGDVLASSYVIRRTGTRWLIVA